MMSLVEALRKAKNELSQATYLSDVAPNEGLRAIYCNRADMLSTLIYAASIYQKLLEERKYD